MSRFCVVYAEIDGYLLMIVTMVTVQSSKVVSRWYSVPHFLIPVVLVIGVLTAVLNVRTLMATANFKPGRKEKKKKHIKIYKPPVKSPVCIPVSKQEPC